VYCSKTKCTASGGSKIDADRGKLNVRIDLIRPQFWAKSV
jgi:hypothetical protein